MEQLAAALGDVAAHGGSIMSGSPNVRIGKRPAARVGDTLVCPQHGPGSISKGSFTVRINGMPAARTGDLTGCLAPGSPAIDRVLGPAVPSQTPPATTTPAPLQTTATATLEIIQPMANLAQSSAEGSLATPQTWQDWLDSSALRCGTSALEWLNYSRAGNKVKIGNWRPIEKTPFPVNTPGGLLKAGKSSPYQSKFISLDFLYFEGNGAGRLPFKWARSNQDPYSVAEAGLAGQNAQPPAQFTWQTPSLEIKGEGGVLKLNAGHTGSWPDGLKLPEYKYFKVKLPERLKIRSMSVAAELNLLHAKVEADVVPGSDGNRTGGVGKGEVTIEPLKGELQFSGVGYWGDNRYEPKFKISWPWIPPRAIYKIPVVAYKIGAWWNQDKKKDHIHLGVVGGPSFFESIFHNSIKYNTQATPGFDIELFISKNKKVLDKAAADVAEAAAEAAQEALNAANRANDAAQAATDEAKYRETKKALEARLQAKSPEATAKELTNEAAAARTEADKADRLVREVDDKLRRATEEANRPASAAEEFAARARAHKAEQAKQEALKLGDAATAKEELAAQARENVTRIWENANYTQVKEARDLNREALNARTAARTTDRALLDAKREGETAADKVDDTRAKADKADAEARYREDTAQIQKELAAQVKDESEARTRKLADAIKNQKAATHASQAAMEEALRANTKVRNVEAATAARPEEVAAARVEAAAANARATKAEAQRQTAFDAATNALTAAREATATATARSEEAIAARTEADKAKSQADTAKKLADEADDEEKSNKAEFRALKLTAVDQKNAVLRTREAAAAADEVVALVAALEAAAKAQKAADDLKKAIKKVLEPATADAGAAALPKVQAAATKARTAANEAEEAADTLRDATARAQDAANAAKELSNSVTDSIVAAMESVTELPAFRLPPSCLPGRPGIPGVIMVGNLRVRIGG